MDHVFSPFILQMQTKLSLLLLPLTYQLGLAIQYPYNNNNTTTNEKMRSFELTQEEDFNVHGAFAILELAGESDLAETLRNGDWRVMPQAFRVLKKNVVNEHDAELAKEAEEHVQEYYNLLGRYLGVYPRDIDDVPTVLQNLHKYVDHATQKTLSDFLRLFLADDGIGYMDFLSEASKLDISDTSQNHPYMINVLLECSRVIIDGMDIVLNTD